MIQKKRVIDQTARLSYSKATICFQAGTLLPGDLMRKLLSARRAENAS